MYSALDIAKYTINKCIEIERPISNLQLQKILYYIQGEHIKQTGNILFQEDIVAWTYGVCIPDVYYQYNNYSSSAIEDIQSHIDVNDFTRKIIDPVIEIKSQNTTWELVEMNHLENPWINVYTKNPNGVISIKELRNWFKEEYI